MVGGRIFPTPPLDGHLARLGKTRAWVPLPLGYSSSRTLLIEGRENAQATKRVSPTISEHSGGILILRFIIMLFLSMVSIGFAERCLESFSLESLIGAVLCAAPIPLLLAPRWFTWRILWPLGWYSPARIVLWLTSSPDADYQGMRHLLAASMGKKTHQTDDRANAVDRWTHLIEALRMEESDELQKLDLMLGILDQLPPASPVREKHSQDRARATRTAGGRTTRLGTDRAARGVGQEPTSSPTQHHCHAASREPLTKSQRKGSLVACPLSIQNPTSASLGGAARSDDKRAKRQARATRFDLCSPYRSIARRLSIEGTATGFDHGSDRVSLTRPRSLRAGHRLTNGP